MMFFRVNQYNKQFAKKINSKNLSKRIYFLNLVSCIFTTASDKKSAEAYSLRQYSGNN